MTQWLNASVHCGRIESRASELKIMKHWTDPISSFGRKLILNDAIPAAIKPNDLVVLCLEYINYSAMPAGEALWQLLRVDPSVAFDLSLSDMVDLSESGFSYLGGQLRNSIKNLLRGRRGQAFNPIYTTDGFNQFGDLTSHWGLGYREGPREIKPLVLEGKNFDHAFNDVSEFVKECREKGADVVFSFPPIREDQYLKNKKSIEALTALLTGTLQLDAIASAEAMAFSEEFFLIPLFILIIMGWSGVQRYLLMHLAYILLANDVS